MEKIISDIKAFFSGDKGKKRLFSAALWLLGILLVVLLVVGIRMPKKEYHFDLNGFTGWKKYNYKSEFESNKEATSFTAVKDGDHDCILIESKVNNDARIHRTLKVKPSSYYKITVSFRTVDVEGGVGLNISGYNMSGTALRKTGTSDGWQRLNVYLETLEDQKNVDFSLGLGGYGSESSGKAYFDDLDIVKVNELPSDIIPLKLTPNSSSESDKKNDVSIWFKLLFAVFFLSTIIYCGAAAIREDRSRTGRALSLENGTFERMDLIILAAMTLVTALFSFYKVGSRKGTPNNYWKPANANEYVQVSFKEETDISRFVFFSGIPKEAGSVSIQYQDEEGFFRTAVTLTKDDLSFYKWAYKSVNFKAKTVRVISERAGLWLNEVGFYTRNANGEWQAAEVDLSTMLTSYEETETSGKADYLFDEQDTVRPDRSLFDSTYFDEIYFPRTAYEQIHGLSIYERTHPPLGKVFMQWGIRIFGMNTFGWRFAGTLFGVMLVPLLYAFGLKVFRKRFYAFLTAFLVMFDFMRLAQTRLATIDSYACFFSVAMLYFMYDVFSRKSYEISFRKTLLPLFFSGLMFGLGASSKWTCIYTGGALAILFFLSKILEFLDVKKGRAFIYEGKDGKRKLVSYTDGEHYFNTNFLPTCGACIVFFVLIPIGIYLLSYIPYMASNPDKSLLDIVIDNQKYMYNYHSNLESTHSYGSKWYTWPIMVRPIWYYVGYNVPDGMRSTITSMGNPAIWWLGLPCFIAACWMAWKNKDKRMGFFAVAYMMQYAPWILVNRVCFIYHYFTASVLAIFFIVYVIRELLEKKVVSKWVVYGYMAVVVLLFVLYYPVLTGIPVAQSYVDKLKIFSSWSF